MIYARQMIMPQLSHFRINTQFRMAPHAQTYNLKNNKKMFYYLQTIAKRTKLN